MIGIGHHCIGASVREGRGSGVPNQARECWRKGKLGYVRDWRGNAVQVCTAAVGAVWARRQYVYSRQGWGEWIGGRGPGGEEGARGIRGVKGRPARG